MGGAKLTEMRSMADPPMCSFCGKWLHEVEIIVAGTTANICDECVEQCREIVGEKRAANPPEN